MKPQSYQLALKATVGEFQICVIRYLVAGPQLKAQMELWNGKFIISDTIAPGRQSSRRRLLKEAGRHCAITDADFAALDGEMGRLGSVCEEDYRQRQRAQQTRARAEPASGAQADADAEAEPEGAAADGAETPPREDTPPAQEEEEGGPASQATQLVRLAASWQPFHTPDGDAYVTFAGSAGQRETYRLTTKPVRQQLSYLYYRDYDKAARTQSLHDALNTLAGKALHEGRELPVYTRLAWHEGDIWLDLGSPAWDAVQITAGGWRIVSSEDVPVKFRRPRGLLALPQPMPGGSIDPLRAFLNLTDDRGWKMVVGWLVMAFRPTGPYPVLWFHGEQGAAKSTAARCCRRLIDPNRALLRKPPKHSDDLIIAANNGWVVALDNLSRVSEELSDDLCRLATGGGLGKRELYTDDDEIILDAMRPIILTGIEEPSANGDLLDRAVSVELPTIADEDRKAEKTFWQAFDAVHPALLGALLDSVACALRCQDTVRLPGLPRMADFALWVTAAEPALGWSAGAFMKAYDESRATANDLALEAVVVVPAIRALVDAHTAWQGTMTGLLAALGDQVGEIGVKQKGWPTRPNVLSGMLKRVAPNLRQIGIRYWTERKAGGNRSRIVHLALDPTSTPGSDREETGTHTAPPREEEQTEETSSHTVPSSPNEASFSGGDGVDGGTMAAGWDDGHRPIEQVIVPPSSPREGPLPEESSARWDDGTIRDDDLHLYSASPDEASYTYITDRASLLDAMDALGAASVVGLDTETTGLDPHTDQLRLLSLATIDHTYVLDLWKVEGWQEMVRPLLADAGRTVITHNGRFDTKFLLSAGVEIDATLHDTMIAAQLLEGGQHLREEGYFTLAGVAERTLGQTLAKEHQQSDWSAATLSDEQLAYAARDASVLLPLYEHQRAAIAADGLQRVAAIEAACTPALAWLEHVGMCFDAEAWRVLSDTARQEEQRLRREILAALAPAGANQFGGFPLKVSSNKHLLHALRQVGIDVPDTEEETLTPVRDRHPVVPLILAWREASKRAGTYGIAFISKYVHPATGRVHGDYWQIGSRAGRTACTFPNMQNIPRSADYRRCFCAPVGHALVKCDYSQIEVRIIAAIAQDRVMLEAFRTGADLYKRTAAAVLGIAEAEVSPEQRQLAKVLVLGLMYGMGAQTLAAHAAGYGVGLTVEQAAQYRDRFFAVYSGLRRWHRAQPDGTMTTRTLTGRTRANVETFMQKINSPIQGTASDGLKAALARLWRYRHEAPTARLVATVHDEIDTVCPAEDREHVAEWLSRHMVAAMEEIVGCAVPIVAEATIGRDWAGTPLDEGSQA
jgi:DNA polymerase I-like protein with 3'-5' exonuclease and polymerase domains